MNKQIELTREIINVDQRLSQLKKEVNDSFSSFFYQSRRVNAKVLFNMPFNVSITSAPGVITTRILSENPNVAKYRVHIKKGACVPQHSHDVLETIKLVSGYMRDRVSGRVIAEGTKMCIKPGEVHELEAIEESHLIVKYYKLNE